MGKSEFLDLFFDDGETFCVSQNQFANHAISKDMFMNGEFVINPNAEKIHPFTMQSSEVVLLAINPINGPRLDKNVTAHRSFLIELDDGSLKSQMDYVKEMKMPYSTCVFSGNKSMHFGIVLDQDIPKELWRMVNKWLLNIMERADQQTLNPSRCIRFPDNIRPETKQKQKLIELKGRVDSNAFFDWLNKYPEKKPKPKPVRTDVRINPNMKRNVPKWIHENLKSGVTEERNNTWFSMSCAMAARGFSIDEVFTYFGQAFHEDPDFQRKEWETAIESGFKKVLND